jgi:Trk K+ transport system NAD-binding subunit
LRLEAPAVEQDLEHLPLPEGALIGGIIRGDRVIVPRGTTSLRVGDRLIVISQPESFDEALRVLTGEEG